MQNTHKIRVQTSPGTVKFWSLYVVIYTIASSRKYKCKTSKEKIFKIIVPRGLNNKIVEVQEKHYRANEDQQRAIDYRDKINSIWE